MKNNKLILNLLITLLVIFSSNVMAVSIDKFGDAITSFIGSMDDYNDRLYYSTNETQLKLGYDNRTAYSPEEDTTLLYFNEASWIAYVYHQVLSVDITNDDEILTKNFIVDDIKNSGGFFNYPEDIQELNGHKKITDESIRKMLVGDLVVQGDNIYIYIGNKEFAYFSKTQNSIQIASADVLKKGGKAYVGEIEDSILRRCSNLRYLFDGNAVQVNATTMADELNNLKLKINITDDGFVFTNSETGEDISIKELISAINTGWISQHGVEVGMGTVGIQLGFKGANDEFMKLKENDYANSAPTATITKNKSTSNSLKINNFELLDIDDFEAQQYSYWGSDYIFQTNHSLYVVFYVFNTKTRVYEEIEVIFPVANGIQTTINGNETYIECFSELVDERIEDYTKPTLQDFLNLSLNLEIPEEVYELDFLNGLSKQTIENSGGYKVNELGEILFTTNKSGTYLIEIETPQGEIIINPIVLPASSMSYGTETILVGFNQHESSISSIRCAGAEAEGNCEDSACVKNNTNFKLGDYVQNHEQKAFPLLKNKVYVFNMEVGTNSFYYETDKCTYTITYLHDSLIEIRDHEEEGNGVYRKSQANSGVQEVHRGGKKELSMFERLEFLMSFCVRNVANGLVLTISDSLGWTDPDNSSLSAETVTIDTIVFDEYPLTKLNLFKSNLGLGEQRNSFIQSFADNINKWFNNFTMIAIAVYLAILLYMGIRITMNSTASKKSMYKELFVHWITGIMLLFLFPVVIMYAIEINTAFVGVVRDSTYSANIDSSSVVTEYDDPDESTEISTDESEKSEVVKNMEANPFDQNDTGYMAVMARRAHSTQRLSYAMVYLIMTFQLAIIAVMYYKRLFMVAFLIVIFPVIMIVHLLEKVADLKTGGVFSKWTKEIMITIFVQSIHAVIYSFSCVTVQQAADKGNNDWILMLVGVTFLFNGESIMKKIIGQTSESAPSLESTAIKTTATVMAAKKMVKGVSDNVIGAGSHLGKAIQFAREEKKYGLKASLVDSVGAKTKEYRMPPASELEHYKPEYDEFGDTQARDLGNAIQVINHAEVATPDQIAQAMSTIENVSKNTGGITNGKYSGLFQDLNMQTYQGLQNAKEKTAIDAVSGTKTKEQIDMELTLELERICPGRDIRSMKLSIYSQLGNPLTTGKRRSATESDVKKEIDTAKKRYDRMRNDVNIADTRVRDDGKELEKSAIDLLQNVYGKDKQYTKEQYQMALSVCMLKDAKSGKYDANELMTSANFACRNQGKSREFERMSRVVGHNLEDFRYVVAEKVCEKGYGKDLTDRRNWRRGEIRLKDQFKDIEDTCKTARKILDKSEVKRPIKKEKPLKTSRVYLNDPPVNAGNPPVNGGEVKTKTEVDDVITLADMRSLEIERGKISVTEEEQIIDIVAKRKEKNTREQQILHDFSLDMIQENKEYYQAKIDGMTREELLEMQEITRIKKRKEIIKTIETTTATAVGAPIGAGVAIGLSDDKGAFEEAVAGALGGAAAFDAVVEGVYDEKHTKKVKVRNPYTGEVEEVMVTVSGAYADVETLLGTGEFQAAMSSKLKEQFLMNKVRHDQKIEDNKVARIKQEEYKKRLDASYKKAMEDINRNNNNNNNNNGSNT